MGIWRPTPLFGAASATAPRNEHLRNAVGDLRIHLRPAGAICGHLGLTQIQRTGQPGRTRAIIGLTLSYTIIVVLIVALVVWLVLRGDADTPPLATSAPGPQTSATVSPTAPTAATSEDVFALSCGEGAGPRAEWPGRTVSDAELGSIPMDLTDIKSALKSDVSVDRLAADPPRTDLLRPPYPDGTVEPAACTSLVFAGTADAYRDIGYRAVYLTRISAPAPEYVSVIQVASSYPDSAAALRALENSPCISWRPVSHDQSHPNLG